MLIKKKTKRPQFSKLLLKTKQNIILKKKNLTKAKINLSSLAPNLNFILSPMCKNKEENEKKKS